MVRKTCLSFGVETAGSVFLLTPFQLQKGKQSGNNGILKMKEGWSESKI